MKFIKWKSLILTCSVCLAMIIPGVILWNRLPKSMAIHFDINNVADNFAHKGFVVFGMPLLMVGLQTICCFVNDINSHKHGERKKLENVTKWIIPVMTVILQTVTIGYSLGWNLDIRRVAIVIVSGIFIVTGNYLPKLDYIKNYDIDTEKARKINRFTGYASVVMGLLFFITIFMPPIASVVALLAMVPYTLGCIIYAILICRKK
ncbi:MAG: DUF1648 domain-containing protein [Clostridia bacterium]|nr:DUF1648 domain-containing protein [Clostridia bacterium]